MPVVAIVLLYMKNMPIRDRAHPVRAQWLLAPVLHRHNLLQLLHQILVKQLVYRHPRIFRG